MERKARENLEAATRLLEGDPVTNASASRAYYAAYHAVWCAMVDAGHDVPEVGGRRYFPHRCLPDEARRAGILDAERADDLVYLRDVRIRADYRLDDVEHATSQACVIDARRLIGELLGDEEEAT
jgi:hypothetical protein